MNHSFANNPLILQKPVMIVGADVTHPSPGQMNSPSIAAVAASHDKRAFKYNMIWRMQPKGEMIVDLQNIMVEQLMYFYSVSCSLCDAQHYQRLKFISRRQRSSR